MAQEKPVVLIRALGTPALFDVDNLLRVFEYNPNLWRRLFSQPMENRILRAKLPTKLRLSNPERATLPEIGKRLGHKVLGEVACVARPAFDRS